MDSQYLWQELQGMRRELETAVSAATVAEAQEAQAVNEAREADGRVEVAKILGGNRGTRGFDPEKVWKTPGKVWILEILWTIWWTLGETYWKTMRILWSLCRFKPLNIGFNQNMVLLPTMLVKATIILCINLMFVGFLNYQDGKWKWQRCLWWLKTPQKWRFS